MLVYGDRLRPAAPRDELVRLAGRARALGAAPARDATCALLIDLGELGQGLCDHAFAPAGEDAPGPLDGPLGQALLAAARAHLAACAGRPPRVERLLGALEELGRRPLPERLELKVQEGFAFYALYPELYASAARALRAGLARPPFVIGLRSIGVTLAAVAAAAAGSPPPVTLRPTGHPFRREVRLSPGLAAHVLAGAGGRTYALVDEGPGLSGSSFGAAADWLEARGVARRRIAFLPGHAGGLGPQATRRHRERWGRAARYTESFERAFLAGGRPELAAWLGRDANAGPPDDVSAGRWRAKFFARRDDYPPVHPFQERRKYVFLHRGRPALAKFSGLGRYGESAHARAVALARRGLVPPVIGLRYGFLVVDWLAEGRPLTRDHSVERGRLLEVLGGHLGALAADFLARPGEAGAGPRRLYEMACHNIKLALGPDAAGELGRFAERLAGLEASARPVCTDNKLQPWEWLELPGGRLAKCDAVDHHAGHDLVGAQDVAWDLAGAWAEFDLASDELDALAERVARASPARPRPDGLAFYRACYLAFQIGHHALAEGSCGEPDEARRHARERERYAGLLAGLLGGTPR